MTGFSKAVREAVADRAHQHCERCGAAAATFQWHHRRPRGAGGSKASDTNTAANCLLLCRDCHSWVELHREESLHFGWLVRQGHPPAGVPVWLGWRWVLLDDQGGVVER